MAKQNFLPQNYWDWVHELHTRAQEEEDWAKVKAMFIESTDTEAVVSALWMTMTFSGLAISPGDYFTYGGDYVVVAYFATMFLAFLLNILSVLSAFNIHAHGIKVVPTRDAVLHYVSVPNKLPWLHPRFLLEWSLYMTLTALSLLVLGSWPLGWCCFAITVAGSAIGCVHVKLTDAIFHGAFIAGHSDQGWGYASFAKLTGRKHRTTSTNEQPSDAVGDFLASISDTFPVLYQGKFAAAKVAANQLDELTKEDLLCIGVPLGHAITILRHLRDRQISAGAGALGSSPQVFGFHPQV